MEPLSQYEGIFYDGLTSKQHPVTVTLHQGMLVLQFNETDQSKQWQYDHISIVDFPTKESPGRITYQLDPDVRIVINAESFYTSIKEHLPKKERFCRHFAEYIGWKSVVLIVMLIAISIPVIYQVIEDNITMQDEIEVAKALHHSFVEKKKICSDVKAESAMQKIIDHLTPHIQTQNNIDYRVTVVMSDMPNAMTVGGGFIIINDQLLLDAESQEELIGVLAHEMAHVELRHISKRIAQMTMFSILDFAIGGGGLVTTAAFMQTSYSRKDEESADRWAVELLHSAKVDPDGLGAFFARLHQKYEATIEQEFGESVKTMMEHLSTHPASDHRREYVSQMRNDKINYSPVLDINEWLDLKYVCSKKREEESNKSECVWNQ